MKDKKEEKEEEEELTIYLIAELPLRKNNVGMGLLV